MSSNHPDFIPALTPKIYRWMFDFMRYEKIRKLLEEFGSPVNVLHPEILVKNQHQFARVLREHGLQHLVCFARKANRSTGLVKATKEGGFGVDVASYHELEACIALGVDPNKLVITAAIKPRALIDLALKNQVLLIIDNHDEIEAIRARCQELSLVAKLGVRVSGFMHEGQKLYSRFGFDISETFGVISDLIHPDENFDYQGLHFHLDGYSVSQRAAALDALIELADHLQKESISTSFIDIGGGIPISYLASGEEWQIFQQELQKSLKQERTPITFQNNGLGFENVNGKIKGKLATYPYYNELNGAEYLNQLLLSSTTSGETLGRKLKDRKIELRLEPGRSLLNQVGFTAASVIFRKKDQQNNLLVGLEMNRSKLMSSSADFLLDPIILHQNPVTKFDEPCNGYLVGGYCLEGDIILKRKISFEKMPEVGDIICFPNTAGYLMHFYETLSHLYPITPNLLLDNYGHITPEKSPFV